LHRSIAGTPEKNITFAKVKPMTGATTFRNTSPTVDIVTVALCATRNESPIRAWTPERRTRPALSSRRDAFSRKERNCRNQPPTILVESRAEGVFSSSHPLDDERDACREGKTYL
jgi:hypothetical protein